MQVDRSAESAHCLSGDEPGTAMGGRTADRPSGVLARRRAGRLLSHARREEAGKIAMVTGVNGR